MTIARVAGPGTRAPAAAGGYRYYFGTPGSARPFVAARLGATRTDGIRATFEIPDGGITIADVPFYDSGWSATGGLDAGVIMPVGETFSVVLTGGVRYVADLKDNDSAIGGLGLASINDTGSRVSLPVTLSARWDFCAGWRRAAAARPGVVARLDCDQGARAGAGGRCCLPIRGQQRWQASTDRWRSSPEGLPALARRSAAGSRRAGPG